VAKLIPLFHSVDARTMLESDSSTVFVRQP